MPSKIRDAVGNVMNEEDFEDDLDEALDRALKAFLPCACFFFCVFFDVGHFSRISYHPQCQRQPTDPARGSVQGYGCT